MIPLPFKFFCAALIGTLIVSACSTSPRVTKIYTDETFVGPLDNLLIVGIHENRTMRARFERSISEAVIERGGNARAISAEIDAAVVLDEATVRQVARDIAADGVLVTRLKSIEAELEVLEGRTEMRVDRKDERLADFFRYDYTDIKDPDEINVRQTVVLSTDLYSRADGKKVWSIESTSFERVDVDDILDDEVKAIVGQLGKDRLIK